MESKNIFFQRYVWLINLINTRPDITFNQIKEAWDMSELKRSLNREFSPRTFENHKKAIRDFFDIDIVCNKSTRGYSLGNKMDDLAATMLNSISVSNLLADNKDMRDRILLEDIPSSHEFLSDIISAMRFSKKISLGYKKFHEREQTVREVSPYCVKLFKQRWYLLGDTDKGFRIFSLDRIQSVDESYSIFKMPKDFVAEDYFKNYYGVYVDKDVKPLVMQLKVSHVIVDYFRTLPLHWSQKEIETTPEYSIFSYHVAPTSELCLEILSKGNNVEVLGPSVMRDMVISTINKMKTVYGQ